MNYRCAMFPGSFDPVTTGHIDIVRRMSKLYEKVYVVVCSNRSKTLMFSDKERHDFIYNSVKDIANVEVLVWDGLLVDFAKKYDVGVVIRGIRNLNDFLYEFEVSELNKSLCPGIEVQFMICDKTFSLVRSSYVKELASFGADVSDMVPKDVAKALINKFKG